LVSLEVFDIQGRSVKTITNSVQDAGEHEVIFDGTKYSSGVYFYRLTIFSTIEPSKFYFTSVKKMVLVK
jgi:hypothetical protein